MDEQYNAVHAQVCLAKYPQETANILHHDIFWFFLKDEEFVSKTIKDSRIYLDKFPASKVRQLAKQMEALKATAWHNKQVASDPQVAQINLMRHQQTDIPPGKHKTKAFKSRPPSHKCHTSQQQVSPYKRKSVPKQTHTSKDRCSKCGDSRHVERIQVLSTSVSPVTCMDILQVCVSRNKYLSNQKHPKHTN